MDEFYVVIILRYDFSKNMILWDWAFPATSKMAMAWHKSFAQQLKFFYDFLME